jgi:hypothetical protein
VVRLVTIQAALFLKRLRKPVIDAMLWNLNLLNGGLITHNIAVIAKVLAKKDSQSDLIKGFKNFVLNLTEDKLAIESLYRNYPKPKDLNFWR